MSPSLETSGASEVAPAAVQEPILFFDGDCALCNRSVQTLLAMDRRHRLKFAPLQGETARRLLAPDAIDLKTMIVVDARGEARRSTALVRALGHIGGTGPFLGTLLWLVPRPIRDFFYNQVAGNRYRLFGKTESCRLPRPGERDQFLP